MDVLDGMALLWRRKFTLLMSAVLAAAVGVLATHDVRFSPFSVDAGNLEYGVGQASFILDGRRSPISDIEADIGPLAQRATLLSSLFAGSEMRSLIARDLMRPVDEVALASIGVGATREPNVSDRVEQIVLRRAAYQVEFAARLGLHGVEQRFDALLLLR